MIIFLDCYRFDRITYHVVVFLFIYTMLYAVVFSPHPQNIDQSIQGWNMKSNWTPATWISNLSDPYKNHKKNQRTIKQAIYHGLAVYPQKIRTFKHFVYFVSSLSHAACLRHGSASMGLQEDDLGHLERKLMDLGLQSGAELGPETCGTNDFCVELLHIYICIYICIYIWGPTTNV